MYMYIRQYNYSVTGYTNISKSVGHTNCQTKMNCTPLKYETAPPWRRMKPETPFAVQNFTANTVSFIDCRFNDVQSRPYYITWNVR